MNEYNLMTIPGRFIEARTEIGMTQVKLSELSGISRVTISNLEKGLLLSPKMDTVVNIAWVLHKPVDFFYTAKQNSFEPTTDPSFRSLHRKTKLHNDQTEIVIDRYLDFLDILYKYIEPRFCDISTDMYYDKPPLALSNYEIEAFASKVREYWNLTRGPIFNLCTIFENHGLFCHQSKLPDDVDSVNQSFRPKSSSNELAIIIVNSDSSYFRQRFDLAHELGHYVLHHYLSKDEYAQNLAVYEQQANRFAAAFLMPNEEFVKSITNISLSGLKALKEKWRVSMSALIYRMAELSVISDMQKQSLFINLSKRGWRKKEPLDEIFETEKPYYLCNAYSFLLQSKVLTAKEIIERTGLYREDIVDFIGNYEWFFQDIPKNNFTLKI